MRQLNFSSINAAGDYRRRAMLNFDRLEQEQYLPGNVWKGDQTGGWPADFEGRTVLALALQAQATGREPRHLGAIIDRLPEHFNERGYMGRMLGEGEFDEQQLSGHSWLLRGLCEYYLWTSDKKALDMAVRMTETLFLPALGAYATYPTDPEQRGAGGEASGHLTGDLHGGWYCSTDIGCAFIPLDGVTQVYEITLDERVKALVEAMVAKFLTLDFVGATLQTHATLTGTRGLLRFYECTGNSELLDAARRIYGLYRSEAMTENYENFNWFARPEWTEPCAVIDSFMVAVGLWKHTGERCYLDDAHAILFNGMGYELRPSGGFGTNRCVGAADEFLSPDCYEAWWCCLMRGGEGLARAIQYLGFEDGNRVLLPFYENCELRMSAGGGEIVLEETTGYPISGEVSITVKGSSATRPIALGLYVPPWADGVRCTVGGEETEASMSGGLLMVGLLPEAGDRIELTFEMALRTEATINPRTIAGYRTLRHGPLILGVRHSGEAIKMPELDALEYMGDGRYTEKGTVHAADALGQSPFPALFAPIRGLVDLSEDEAKTDRVQVLFAAE